MFLLQAGGTILREVPRTKRDLYVTSCVWAYFSFSAQILYSPK